MASSTHSTPPLHSPSGRESSAESSPVSTPASSRHHSVAHPNPYPPQHYQVPPVAYHQPDAKAQDIFSQFTTADEFDSDDILFPNDDAIVRLVGALLLEQNDKWTVQRTRYMTLETIASMGDDPVISLPAAAS